MPLRPGEVAFIRRGERHRQRQRRHRPHDPGSRPPPPLTDTHTRRKTSRWYPQRPPLASGSPAERIELTGQVADDVAIARDEHGNARGGVRSTTLDVPVATHQALNEPRDPDRDLTPGSCLVYGSQLDFPGDELASLYGDRQTYLDEVDERLDELIEDGWMLDQFADELRQQAATVDGFDG